MENIRYVLVGSKILDCTVGDVVKIDAPMGIVEYEILQYKIN